MSFELSGWPAILLFVVGYLVIAPLVFMAITPFYEVYSRRLVHSRNRRRLEERRI
jgi:hypothetical protein